MDLQRYQSHGKLVERISIPVDIQLLSTVKAIKNTKFDFNNWARDLISSHLQEVVNHCKLDIRDSNSSVE